MGPERTPEERLDEIEDRLAALERRVGEGDRPPELSRPPVVSRPPEEAPGAARASGLTGLSVPLILGWAGAAALVLAAAYLVKLGIVSGWITPARLNGLAGLAGLALVTSGVVLRLRDRSYASLLAAAGIAVLYLAIFSAHLLHGLIGATTATALAAATAALSLGLHLLFRAGVFVAFALAGSYAVPLLIETDGGPVDLGLYLTVWNVLYAGWAVWLARRPVYLAAAYASFFLYGAVEPTPEAWPEAALFPVGWFLLFAVAVAWYWVRHRRPLDPLAALLHFGAMVYFYVIEWRHLDVALAGATPWLAAGFAVALYLCWWSVRAYFDTPGRAGREVVNGFGAVVLVHAVWLAGVADPWTPAVGLGLAVLLFTAPRIRALNPWLGPGWWPYEVAAYVFYGVGYLLLLVGWEAGSAQVADDALLVLYPAALYVAYFLRPRGLTAKRKGLLLGVAHTQALAAVALLVSRWWGDPATTLESLWLSLGWAAIGVGWLWVAVVGGDRTLARSTLGIFALFAGKVVLFDLDRTDALVRVGILAVLGLALYAGGWIYRRIEPERKAA